MFRLSFSERVEHLGMGLKACSWMAMSGNGKMRETERTRRADKQKKQEEDNEADTSEAISLWLGEGSHCKEEPTIPLNARMCGQP